MTITLMCDPCTVNSRKVVAGLKLMKTPYDFKKIDYFKGEQKAPEFVKINPSATVPAAVDGDLVITEFNAILAYAADVTPGAEKFYPKDLKVRATVNRWLLWEASAWFPSCYVYLVENVVKPLLKAEPDQSVLDGESARFHKLAGILEGQLTKHAYLAGPEVTIADIAVASPMHAGPKEGLPLEKYPKLQAWYANIAKLPEWVETQPVVNEALGLDKYVTSTLNYTKDLGDKLTELYFYEDEKSKGIHEPGDDPQKVQIHDGWSQWKSFSEDKHGFSVHEFNSTYPSDKWEDEQLVKNQFYPEVVQLLKDKLGAKRVLVFDHTIRTKGNNAKKLTQETNTTQRAPVSLVHCDYTAESGPVRVRQLLPDDAEDLLSRRTAFINVPPQMKMAVILLQTVKRPPHRTEVEARLGIDQAQRCLPDAHAAGLITTSTVTI